MSKHDGDLVKQRERSDKRARVLLKAKLRSGGDEVDAWLKDLSRKGALLECEHMPPVGSAVTFKRGSFSIPARVTWCAGNRVGLQFDRTIEESEVLIQRPPVQAVAVEEPEPQPYRRPDFRCAELTEEEKKLAESWGVTVGLAVEREWLGHSNRDRRKSVRDRRIDGYTRD